MSEQSGSTDTPATGTEGGADDIMREIMGAQEHTEDARERVRRIMDRANDKNAGRPEAPLRDPARRLRPSDGQVEYRVLAEPVRAPQLPPADDPADPTKPVLGTTDLIEEIVANTQRYGAFAHWPGEKKSETLGLVQRTVKQQAIAQQVVAVARRDTIHARAYRERAKLVKDAERLLKGYSNRFTGSVSVEEMRKDPMLYAEGVNYLIRFVQKVADLPRVPDDEESSDGE